MPYTAAAIANYFLELAEENGVSLTPMQVQKLVFYAHGWSLALNEEPLIDEQVEAWKFGPVIRSLYHDLKSFGSDAVTSPIRKMRRDPSIPAGSGTVRELLKQFRFVTPTVPDHDTHTRTFVKQVWEVYSRYSGVQLSNMTHYPDTPWSKIMVKYDGNPPKGTDIPPEMIRDYFSRLASDQ